MNLTVFAGILLAVTMVTARRASLGEKTKQAAGKADEPDEAMREAARPAKLVEKIMRAATKAEEPDETKRESVATVALALPRICQQPKKIGRCKAALRRVYYDANTKTCRPFIYGGCGGNGNNFENMKQCIGKCIREEANGDDDDDDDDEDDDDDDDAEKMEVEEVQECYTGNGVAYRGYINITESGKLCQNWNTQTPHTHEWTPENHPNTGLVANYCRLGGWTEGLRPWCFTMEEDTTWEYCNVPECPVYGHCLQEAYEEYPCDHGHRVGCLKNGLYAGYCWRSCLTNGLYIGFEYPRNEEWNYLRCSDPSLGKEADMECVKKGAGTGRSGRYCYASFTGKTQ